MSVYIKKGRFKEVLSVGQLDSGSLVHRVDDEYSRDWHGALGLRYSEYPGSDVNSEPSQLASCIRDHDWRDRRGRTFLATLHEIDAAVWAASY